MDASTVLRAVLGARDPIEALFRLVDVGAVSTLDVVQFVLDHAAGICDDFAFIVVDSRALAAVWVDGAWRIRTMSLQEALAALAARRRLEAPLESE